MKSIKALLAIVLACTLALGLFACAAAEEEEEAPALVAKTPLAVAQSDPLMYFNALVGLLRGAEGFVMETGYGMDDIQAGNSALQAGKDVIKGNIINYIKGSLTYKAGEGTDMPALYPALCSALQAQDLLEGLKISDVLELEVAKRLVDLEKDIAEGRNTSMKNKDADVKREYVLEQMGDSAVKTANNQYQIEGRLATAAAERLLTPADKADILAQLDKAGEYLVVEDYSLEPAEFTLFATVNKAFIEQADATDQVRDPARTDDHIKELRLELKSALTATATGVGAFEGEGAFPITLTLTKSVKFKDITWKQEETNENA